MVSEPDLLRLGGPEERMGLSQASSIGDRKGTTKKLCDKDLLNFLARFASQPLFYWVMTGNPLEFFRKFFGAVGAIFWAVWVLF